jgi:quinol monooxygenase YgiN
MSDKIAVFVTITAKPGKGDEVAEALATMFGPVESEEGTEVYALHRKQGDPDTILFYELYSNADSLGAHGTSEALKAVGAGLRDLVTGRPEMVMAVPVQAKGLSF